MRTKFSSFEQLKRPETGILALLIVVPVLYITMHWPHSPGGCQEVCEDELGRYETTEVGAISAIRGISQQMTRCPNAVLYSEKFAVADSDSSRDSILLTYEPASQTIAFQPNFSADIQIWKKVTPSAVHAIAAQSKGLSGLAGLGANRIR